MSSRSLAYLSTVPIREVKGLSGKRGSDLADAGVESVAELLLHVPRRYIDRSTQVALMQVPVGEEVTVIGTVQKVSSRRVKGRMVIVDAEISDGTASLHSVWFNQAFRARQLSEGAEVALSGKVERFRGRLQMKSPVVDVLRSTTESLITGRVVPIHPGVGAASPGYLRRAIHNALGRSQPIEDPLPIDMRDRLDLIERDQAIGAVHFPESMAELAPARRRLVFDEFFRLQVALALNKARNEENEMGVAHDLDGLLVDRFIDGLPYDLTGAQRRSIGEISHDLGAGHPMHRLLHGEVGSGKTVVAVATLLTGVQGGFQGAVMAPTEVLAEQHFLTIRDLIVSAALAPRPEEGRSTPVSLFDEVQDEARDDPDRPEIRIGLLTGNSAEVNFRGRGETTREELLAWVAKGEIDLLIGTHALIQEGVHFAKLGVAVVDEQHRFGVHQRVGLKEKGDGLDPDLLIMTATPIPRTLSMTLYGDLDVSTLDEMPPGRAPIKTWTETGDGRDRVHMAIRSEVDQGRQAYVVCPLVEDSAKIEAASAVAEHERLRAVFPDLNIGLLHGQMRPSDKDDAMAGFRSGEMDVLVATTVIEVGIDVPNATLMVIEDADRFGLSQLHQLRGRVGRGEFASQCVLVADPKTDEGAARITAMVKTTDGFKLAEEDLRIRGQGTIFGVRQSGLTDLRIGDILADYQELADARREAFELVHKDPALGENAAIRDEVKALLAEAVEWLFIS